MKHPLWRRLLWHPAVALIPFISFGMRLADGVWTFRAIAGSIVVSIWFLLAVWDLATRHSVLDWLYSDD